MSQPLPDIKLQLFFMKYTRQDQVLAQCITGIANNSEHPSIIYLMLNKIFEFMDKQKPDDVVFLCLKAGQNFHPKVRKRAATIFAKLLDTYPILLTKYAEQIVKQKNLDFLHVLVTKLIDFRPAIRGIKNLIASTLERTFTELKSEQVPKYIQKSTIYFLANLLNADYITYEQGLIILKHIMNFSLSLNYDIYQVIQIFYPRYFNEVEITDKIIERVGDNMNFMLTLVRMEYDMFMYHSAIKDLPPERKVENFLTPRLCAGRFAKKIMEMLLAELYTYDDTRYQTYQPISLDVFKVAGIAPKEVVPIIAEHYSSLMECGTAAAKIQAIMLLTGVGSKRFNTDEETEKNISEFCRLALDDLLFCIKHGTKRSIMSASYVALCYLLRSYGTATMWNHIIRKIVDDTTFSRVDSYRAQLIFEAIEKFHAKCFNRQAVNFIMQKLHTRRDHNEERQFLATKIEAIVVTGDINTNKILESLHMLSIGSQHPWYHGLSAALLANGDPNKLIGKSNYVVFYPHATAPLMSSLKLMTVLIPSLKDYQFDNLTSRRPLADALTSNYEDGFFWAVRFIICAIRNFSDHLSPDVPAICNEIDNLSLRKESYVSLCIIPLCVLLEQLYPDVPEVKGKGKLAVRKYEEKFDKGWINDVIQINYHIAALKEFILSGATRSDGTSFESSVAELCNFIFWCSDLQNTIEYTLELMEAMLEKGLKISKPMLLVIYLARSKSEIAKRIDSVLNKYNV